MYSSRKHREPQSAIRNSASLKTRRESSPKQTSSARDQAAAKTRQTGQSMTRERERELLLEIRLLLHAIPAVLAYLRNNNVERAAQQRT